MGTTKDHAAEIAEQGIALFSTLVHRLSDEYPQAA